MDRADLKAFRERVGWTQEVMGLFMGLSLRAYIDIEKGASPLRKVHELAFERVALAAAASRGDPTFAPTSVRQDSHSLWQAMLGEGATSEAAQRSSDHPNATGARPQMRAVQLKSDSGWTVVIESPNAAPLPISGFANEAEAEDWIELQAGR